ncbi:DUF6261 family protein [Marinifilum fragile]|uniref:DUF6261 family protein n=1 Tax=Marinifilum fragile TaxID=570161 RepID=UPI002AA71A85|nr:DUF6261 family protein [Marinifilum fragile]
MSKNTMISAIDLSHLHNLEFYSFVENILEALMKVNQSLDFQKESDQLRDGLVQFDIIFEKKKISSYTKKVIELDKKRCASFTGLQQCVRGYTKHYNQDIQHSAEIILESIDSMGKQIVYRNYQVKSATFSSLTSAWQNKPGFTEAINTLAMSDWVKHLDEENKAFEAAYLERLIAQGAAPKTKLIDLRADLINAHRGIVKKLEAYCLFENPKALELSKHFNKLIAAYNKELNRRKNKTKKME